jgi:hypothetical protein
VESRRHDNQFVATAPTRRPPPWRSFDSIVAALIEDLFATANPRAYATHRLRRQSVACERGVERTCPACRVAAIGAPGGLVGHDGLVSAGGDPPGAVARGRSIRRQPPRGVDWALAALLVLLQTLAPQTGQPVEITAWREQVAGPLALGQGLPVAWRRQRPFAVATSVLACYAGYVVVVGLAPPFAAWVVIWSLATSGAERRRSIAAALVALTRLRLVRTSSADS